MHHRRDIADHAEIRAQICGDGAGAGHGELEARALGANVRAALRLCAFALVTLTLLVPYLLVLPIGRRAKRPVEVLWFRLVLALIGLKVRVSGQAAREGQVLYAANHVSYLDIMVLGALIDARFIAKADVKGWPVIGVLARLGGTVFVRRISTDAARQNRDLASVLTSGQSLILFAEGTSGDGSKVLPFKSSLFGVAERLPEGMMLSVQPVALSYRRLDGQPVLTQGQRDALAWYGEMTLLPHLWRFLGRRSALVTVTFLRPVPASAGRKALAASSQAAVQTAISP